MTTWDFSFVRSIRRRSLCGSSHPCLLLLQIEQKHCAFVTFTSRQAAETAAEALSNKLIIKGNRCRLLWGKPQQKRDDAAAAALSMLPSQVRILLDQFHVLS